MDYNLKLLEYNTKLTNILQSINNHSYYNFGAENREIEGYIRSDKFNFIPNNIEIKSQLDYIPDNNVTTVGNMRYNLCATTGITYNDMIYAFGGWTADVNNDTTDIYKFDPETNNLQLLTAALPQRVSCNTACVLGNLIYLVGGGYKNVIQVFDPASETVSTLDVALPYSMVDGAVGAYNNNIYIIGGDYSGSNKVYLKTAIRINVTTKQVDVFDNVLTNGVRDPGTCQYGNKIYIVSGRLTEEYACSRDALVYDMETETLSKIADLPEYGLFSRPAVSVIDDYLYVVGTSRHPDHHLKACYYQLNLLTGVWTDYSEQITFAAEQVVAATHNNSFYTFGGVRRTSGLNDWSHRTEVLKYPVNVNLNVPENDIMFHTATEGILCSPIKINNASVNVKVDAIYKGNSDNTVESITDASVYHNGKWINL